MIPLFHFGSRRLARDHSFSRPFALVLVLVLFSELFDVFADVLELFEEVGHLLYSLPLSLLLLSQLLTTTYQRVVPSLEGSGRSPRSFWSSETSSSSSSGLFSRSLSSFRAVSFAARRLSRGS